MGIEYKDGGVCVERGYEAVKKIAPKAKSTFDKNVITDLGGFGGLYSILEHTKTMSHPVLVSGTDGVGTKLKLAINLNDHSTIGIDCVAMCANDILCHGATPLFFLDYYASGFTCTETVAQVVGSIADGCKQAGCALIGGETAEMPGMYNKGDYDLAGFCVGIVDKNKIISGKDIKAGDCLVGLSSNGLHSNGFSLVRKLMGETKEQLIKHDAFLAENGSEKTAIEELLTPTRMYVKPVLQLINEFKIKGIAHNTGGGFIENVPRIFGDRLGCKINLGSYPMPPIFKLLKNLSGLSDQKLCNTFNMGIGLILCVDAVDADGLIKRASELGESAHLIGQVTSKEGVEIV